MALNPPDYDAHLTLGMVEYVVGSMNAFFRLFVHFDQIKGSRQQGAEHLKLVAEHGRYYPPMARILLAVIYLRDKRPEAALPLLTDLAREYPENPLLQREAEASALFARCSPVPAPAPVAIDELIRAARLPARAGQVPNVLFKLARISAALKSPTTTRSTRGAT